MCNCSSNKENIVEGKKIMKKFQNGIKTFVKVDLKDLWKQSLQKKEIKWLHHL